MARRSSPSSVVASALALLMLGAAPPAPPLDFENFGPYPPPPCAIGDEHPPAFALRHGLFSWADAAGDSGLDVQFRSVAFGHLRTGASIQAAVLLGCDYPAGGFFDQWVDVFDLRAGAGTTTAVFVASASAGFDEAPTRSVTIAGRRLVIVTDTKHVYALRGDRLVPAR
jgi:hypothetical protein